MIFMLCQKFGLGGAQGVRVIFEFGAQPQKIKIKPLSLVWIVRSWWSIPPHSLWLPAGIYRIMYRIIYRNRRFGRNFKAHLVQGRDIWGRNVSRWARDVS